MKIITAEGKIEEGIELTPDELAIYAALTLDTTLLEGVYSSSARKKIAASLFAAYHITPRNVSVTVESINDQNEMAQP